MPLPPPDCPRTPVHTRSVRVEGFRRADGALDLEAELLDVKPHDVTLHSGVRAGDFPMFYRPDGKTASFEKARKEP